MKKTILTVVLTMVVMSVFGGCIIGNLNHQHSVEMKNVKNRYESQIDEYTKDISERDKEIEEYENQIYNIVEGKNYKVTINRNGSSVTYRKENSKNKIGKLLGFTDESKTTIK